MSKKFFYLFLYVFSFVLFNLQGKAAAGLKCKDIYTLCTNEIDSWKVAPRLCSQTGKRRTFLAKITAGLPHEVHDSIYVIFFNQFIDCCKNLNSELYESRLKNCYCTLSLINVNKKNLCSGPVPEIK